MDNFEGFLPGSIMAVNLAGNYRPPHLPRVNQVTETFMQCAVAERNLQEKLGALAWLVFDSNSKGKCHLL